LCKFYGQSPQERTRWHRRFEYAERGVLISRRMGCLETAAAHAAKLVLQVPSESSFNERRSTDLQLAEQFCTAVAKPPHNFLRNIDYW
jgi:hypothetical protein